MSLIRERRYAVAGASSLALLGAALLAALASAPANAAADPRLLAAFEWTDGNHDGHISPAEFFGPERPVEPKARTAEPDAMTVTVDSKVPPQPGETREALFARLDLDHDNALSSEEYVAGSVAHTIATPRIAAADANGDGALTEGELASYATAERAAAGDPKAVAAGSMLARGIILEHDQDGDGKVPIASVLTN